MNIHHGQILKHVILAAGYNSDDLAVMTGANKKTIESFFQSKHLQPPIIYQIGIIIGREIHLEYPELFAEPYVVESNTANDSHFDDKGKLAKIFLVDDKEMDAIIFKMLLNKVQEGTDVSIFENGDSALNKLLEISINDQGSLPEHIFLDLNMPIMDGHSFLENFVRLCIDPDRKIKIHILTSSIFYSEITALKSNPLVNNFISKPINLNQLKNIVLV